jgi:hypothetical protein
VADTIVSALRSAPDGLARTDISNLFGRNVEAARIAVSINILLQQRIVVAETVRTSGRPKEVLRLAPPKRGDGKNESNEERGRAESAPASDSGYEKNELNRAQFEAHGFQCGLG